MLLIIIIILYIFQGAIQRSRFRGPNPAIKYDLRDKKENLIVAIVCSIVAVCSVGIIAFGNLLNWSGTYIDLVVLMACGCLGIGFFGAFLSWTQYACCVFYIKRLERYGYEVPQRKKDYGTKLGNLPRSEGIAPVQSEWSRQSIALTIMAVCDAFVFLSGHCLSFQRVCGMVFERG